MARLPRLPKGAIVEPKSGQPNLMFTSYWQRLIEAQEATDKQQSDLIAELQQVQSNLAAVVAVLAAAVADIQRVIRTDAISASFTVPTAVLTQTDNGEDVTVTMIAHTRHYGDGTSVAVNSTSIDVPYGPSELAFYYDDEAREGGDVDLICTGDIKIAQANYAVGRHPLGGITIIAEGEPDPPPGGGTQQPGGGPKIPDVPIP